MFNKVGIDYQMLLRAAQRSIKMGALRQSLMKGQRNIVGFLGEEIYQACCPLAEHRDTFDYDFLLRGQRIDIKTRRFSTNPYSNFDFAVPITKDSYEVDFYVFCGVHSDLTYGWLLGFLSKAEFFKLSILKEAGTAMARNGNYATDNRVIRLSKLRQNHVPQSACREHEPSSTHPPPL